MITTVTVVIPDPYPHSESLQTVIYTIGCVLESPVVLLKIKVLRLEVNLHSKPTHTVILWHIHRLELLTERNIWKTCVQIFTFAHN